MIYEEQVLGNTGCLCYRGGCIPFYRLNSREWILIDSGPHMIRQELKACLEEKKIRIRAVLCSHAHYDHTENNRFLQESHGARLILSAHDAGALHDTVSMKSCFYSYTPQDNQRYFGDMLCTGDEIFLPGQNRIQAEGAVFSIIPLPGHAASHTGFVTPDGVFYGADSIFSAELLKPGKMFYMLNWREALDTMEALKGLRFPRYILAHGGIYDKIDETIQKNLEYFQTQLQEFGRLFHEETGLDRITALAAKYFGFLPGSYVNARLLERMVRSMTEYLLETGAIDWTIKEGVVTYKGR